MNEAVRPGLVGIVLMSASVIGLTTFVEAHRHGAPQGRSEPAPTVTANAPDLLRSQPSPEHTPPRAPVSPTMAEPAPPPQRESAGHPSQRDTAARQVAALPPLPLPKPGPLNTLLAKARSGDARAQHELALTYAARGDHKRAAAWFREAAIAGVPEARLRLAEQYRLGRGVPRDPLEAFIWTRSAAEQGLAAAQLALGDAYERGAGVPANLIEAHAWYSVAAQSDEVEAARRRDALAMLLSPEDLSIAAARAESIAAALVPSTRLNRHLVAEIQRLLRRHGYDPGLDDGFHGERTADAIRRYQRDNGLRVDGMPSEDLLQRLRRSLRPPPPPVIE